jgi:hypothetical protein
MFSFQQAMMMIVKGMQNIVGEPLCKLCTREVEPTYTNGDISAVNFKRTPSSALTLSCKNCSLLKAHN